MEKRLCGRIPKVGIRPIIDGRRRGIRESLEEQTMALARSAARLISENLRHSCGAPVECVIADSCIGSSLLEFLWDGQRGCGLLRLPNLWTAL